MSEITVTIERIEAIEPHPNADKLEIAKVAGTQTLIVKGQFRAGDLCVYFPPDILLPGDVSEALGVAKYLKTATWTAGSFRVAWPPAGCGAHRAMALPNRCRRTWLTAAPALM